MVVGSTVIQLLHQIPALSGEGIQRGHCRWNFAIVVHNSGGEGLADRRLHGAAGGCMGSCSEVDESGTGCHDAADDAGGDAGGDGDGDGDDDAVMMAVMPSNEMLCTLDPLENG